MKPFCLENVDCTACLIRISLRSSIHTKSGTNVFPINREIRIKRNKDEVRVLKMSKFIHKAKSQRNLQLRISHTPPRVLVHEAPRPPGGQQRQVTHPDRAKLKVGGGRSAERRRTMDPPKAALTASRQPWGPRRRFPVPGSKSKEAIKALPGESQGTNLFHPSAFSGSGRPQLCRVISQMSLDRLWSRSAGSPHPPTPRAMGPSRFLQLWSSFFFVFLFFSVLRW